MNTEVMSANVGATIIKANGGVPVGPIKVLLDGELVLGKGYSSVHQFDYTLRTAALMHADEKESADLIGQYVELCSVLDISDKEQYISDMAGIIDQYMLPRLNKFAPPFLEFRRDLDNLDLFGYFIREDLLDDYLNDTDATYSFLIDPGNPDTGFGHLIQYEDKTYLLRQRGTNSAYQGYVDLYDIEEGKRVWEVVENLAMLLTRAPSKETLGLCGLVGSFVGLKDKDLSKPERN